MKRVLMVAYHFPPMAGSSGIQRTLRFVQQLPEFGWQPIVLTAALPAYERTSDDLQAEIPAGTVVQRAFALDTARHLAVAGRYVSAMARPDRWASWRFDAVRQGMQLIRRYQPHALWSTYPIATAHLIAAHLQRRSGLPWIADFRDPMAQQGYPPDPLTRRSFLDIEALAMKQAAHNLFTTPGAARMYRERYPLASERIGVLENGYDEDSFAAVEAAARTMPPLNPGQITLLHSGIVYPSERDPTQLFEALGALRRAGRIEAATFRLRFRAAVHDGLLHALAERHGVQDLVDVLPSISYRDALIEMLRADALLLMQASGCNEQIPAKTYEYLRADRPLLCLSDPAGDTQAVVRAAGLTAHARISSAAEIERALPDFLAAVREARAERPLASLVSGASRRGRAAALAELLDSCAL
jgi:glycosyltransferase involved in cell wall biosynthesis